MTPTEVKDLLTSAIASTKGLVTRSEELVTRVSKLTPDTIDRTAIESPIERLGQLQAALSASLSGLKLTNHPSIGAAAQHVGGLLERVEALPDDLDARITQKLEETQEELAEKAADAIQKIETAYEDAKEKVMTALDELFQRLKGGLGEGHEKIEATLRKIERAIDDAERDVKRIVQSLERTRDTVMSACRALGIGAQAAAPAVEAGTAAFSAVA